MVKRVISVVLLAILLVGCGTAPQPEPTPGATDVPPAAATAIPTATPLPTETPGPGSTRTRPADGMAIVYVPAGEFLMGSTDADPDAADNEKPQHTVYLDAFWMDRTEVTVAQFRAFVQATGYRTLAEQRGYADAWVESAAAWQTVTGADWQHPFGPESSAEDSHPVVQVSWDDAAAYCTWAGGSLPSEGQWEKAARGTDGRIYPWGDGFDGTSVNFCDMHCQRASTYDDGYQFAAPVGSYPAGASPYGMLDMAGNVWEWTADRYAANYYAHSPAENPGGPETGRYRVLRGGSWNHSRDGMRTAFRLDSAPTNVVDNFGFRCVLPAGE
jgi:formylglycine-generating enzyme required for sulfatase activity